MYPKRTYCLVLRAGLNIVWPSVLAGYNWVYTPAYILYGHFLCPDKLSFTSQYIVWSSVLAGYNWVYTPAYIFFGPPFYVVIHCQILLIETTLLSRSTSREPTRLCLYWLTSLLTSSTAIFNILNKEAAYKHKPQCNIRHQWATHRWIKQLREARELL